MRVAGFFLLIPGALAATYFCVLERQNRVEWDIFIPVFLVAVVGMTLLRLAARGSSQGRESLTAEIRTISESVDRLADNITQLDSEKKSLDPYDVHHRIDQLFPKDLNAFVDSRKSLGHMFGLRIYADLMNSFAAGERYLNRVWCCSVDGYVDELEEYLGRAREQFAELRQKMRELVEGEDSA